MEGKSFIQNGECAQANINAGDGTMNIYNNGTLVRSLSEASIDLRSWYSYIFSDYHINRAETIKILEWLTQWSACEKEHDRVMLLVGEAGSGKSVVMRDILLELENQGIKVLGIKSDMLFSTEGSIDTLIGLGKPVHSAIKEIANKEKVVLLVDQIDALSSTLSSNRTPLKMINGLVDEVIRHQNVRVVVSCRPYDWRYDPSLERYNLGHVIHMTNLDSQEVDKILELAGIEIRENELKVKEFLTNPLNLFLFCRIKNGNLFSAKRPNRTLLYEALWNQVMQERVTEADMVSMDSLMSCLDYVTSEMYKRQSLALSESLVNNKFPHEITYFGSHNLLNCMDGQIQFIHQSMYDYIYARLFLGKNRTLDSILEGIHQGLFIRLRLKQVLFYLRDIDEDLYLANLNQLLFSEFPDGKPKYRFHLKHLMVTNIGFLSTITPKEKQFIFKHILNNRSLGEIYLDSIDKKAGLVIFIQWAEKQGDFCKLLVERQLQLLNICERVLFDDSCFVIDFLCSLPIDLMAPEVRQRLCRVTNNIPVTTGNVELVKSLINKIHVDKKEMELEHVLLNLMKIDARYVADCICNHIRAVYDDLPEDSNYHDVSLGHEIEYLLDSLKTANPGLAFDTICDIIEYITRKSIRENLPDHIIKASSLFICFQRAQHYGNFVDKELTYLMDEADKRATGKQDDFTIKLNILAQSDLAVFALIAASAYTKNIDEYVDEAYILSTRIIESNHISSILDYQAKELFRVMFPKLSNNCKDEIMERLKSMNPEWETKPIEYKFIAHPMTYRDYTKAQYYNLLTDEEIKRYPDAKKLRDEKLRLYHNLDNQEPFKTPSMFGWTAMKSDNYEVMTAKQLAKSMIQIKQDHGIDWDKPTKTGNAISMKQHVPERPNVYFDAYMTALEDANLDLDYPILGVESFIECGFDRTALESLVNKILSRFNSNLMMNKPGHVIQACRIIAKYYDHGETAPDILFDFACKVAEKWDDAEYRTEDNSAMSYNDGVNQVRGCAAEEILRYYQVEEKYDRIFDVLHKVASNGAISTRSSVLFRLGVLVGAGRERLKNLFLSLTHDYATSLLNLPLHSQNPLLYIIKDYFSDLKPYFEACLMNKDTHKINVVLLWIAWLRNIDDAEEMMYYMADNTEDARLSLIKEISNYYDQRYMPFILPIYERYMNCDEQNTGGVYDYLFKTIELWPTNERNKFMDRFVYSKACRYCSHYFMDYLSCTAKQQPHDCLRWIPAVYNSKRGYKEWSYSPSKLIDMLIASYNAIQEYDKTDSDLEAAMDLMDEWLHENVNRQHLFNCFKLLDN